MQFKQNMNTSVNTGFRAVAESNPVLVLREKIMKTYVELSEGNTVGPSYQEVMMAVTRSG